MNYVKVLRDAGLRLASALESCAPDAPVPTCPGWTAADLAAHVSTVHRWSAQILRTASAQPQQREQPHEGGPRAALAALLDAIGDTAPDARVWTFSPTDSTARFWQRRQAHETTVHAYDAELTAGLTPQPIDSDLGADGVDEWLDVAAARVRGDGRCVHLHRTDGAGEWLIEMTPEGLLVRREHAKGDAAARGTGQLLYLCLWGRLPWSRCEIFGDESTLERLRC